MMVANSKGASTKLGIVAVFLFVLILFAVWFFSRVDQRPMPVTVVPAFPHLEWPDWLLGIDEGYHRDPRPLVIMGAGDGTNRIFAGTQYGTIHVWPNNPDANEMQTFLDIRDRIPAEERGGEEGFLGVAFHPHYKNNGEFFVYYSEKSAEGNKHNSVLSRFHVSRDDPNRADPKSEEVIMRIPLPTGNHHGGTLVFGPSSPSKAAS